MCKYAELTVVVPASQYVRIEAAANEDSRSLESMVSFLLSEWVLATHSKQRGRSNHAVPGEMRRRGEGSEGGRERSESHEEPARGRAQNRPRKSTKKGRVRA